MSLTYLKSVRIAVLFLSFSLAGFSAPVSATAGNAYSYDAAGRLIRVVYPGGKSVTYTYDAAGNLLAVTPITEAPAPTPRQ